MQVHIATVTAAAAPPGTGQRAGPRRRLRPVRHPGNRRPWPRAHQAALTPQKPPLATSRRLRAGTRDRCLVAAEVIEIGCGRRDGREPHRVLVRTRRRTACASGAKDQAAGDGPQESRAAGDGPQESRAAGAGGSSERALADRRRCCAISYEDVTGLVFSRLKKIRSDVLTRHRCGVMFISLNRKLSL